MNQPLAHSAEKPGEERKRGLRRALFVALILSLVLPGIVAGFVLIYVNLQRTLESDTLVRAEKIADLLQAGMTMPLWEMAPETGRPLITAIAADPSVALIKVRDVDQGVLLEYARQSPNQSAPIVATRTISRNGEKLGQVVIHYSTSAAIDEAWRASMRLLTIVALQLLVSFLLIGAWLSRRVLTPLETLRLSADRIAEGDLYSAVPALRSDEFGQLSARLDAMRDSLAQSVARLEERVEERTFALRAVNTRLQATLDDLQRMQGLLVQAEKLASLGSLVAGVAHELNTPIGTGVTVVSTISEKCVELRRLIDQGIRRSQLDAMIDDIETASTLAQKNLQRAARLIHDFKQVAVDQSSEARYNFSLADNLHQVVVSLGYKLKKAQCEVDIQCDPKLSIYSFPGSFTQIYSNLILNSIHHGFDGWDRPRKITIQVAQQGDELVIDYSDNGRGIPPEILPRIFDPFVTSKRGQGGSGLGTHIIYNLVVQLLRGRIHCASEPGQGAQFHIRLPIQQN